MVHTGPAMTTLLNDTSQLATLARSGDADALGALYARFSPGLMRLAWHLLGSAADAEDVLHDVFLGLPEALRLYKEQGTLEAWLKRVTARVALTRLRTERRRHEVGLEPDVAAPAATPAGDDAAVQRAIAQLPDALRAVFVLKSIEGYAHAEIGALLGISAAASEVRLHRAIKQLRARLSAHEVRP